MSTMLEKAHQQFEARNYGAALDTLRHVAGDLRMGDDAEGAESLLVLALKLREHTSGRLRDECDLLATSAQEALDEVAQHATDPQAGAIAVLTDCRLLRVSDFKIEHPDEGTWDLIFTGDQVLVRQLLQSAGGEPRGDQGQTLSIAWAGLSIDIEDSGAVREGESTGAGVGAGEADAGKLAALPPDEPAATTTLNTVVHLATPVGELFLRYDQQTPEALRRALSPVLAKLRDDEPRDLSQGDASAAHVVDQLDKVADLLNRGVITPVEFAQLKADLLSEGE